MCVVLVAVLAMCEKTVTFTDTHDIRVDFDRELWTGNIPSIIKSHPYWYAVLILFLHSKFSVIYPQGIRISRTADYEIRNLFLHI